MGRQAPHSINCLYNGATIIACSTIRVLFEKSNALGKITACGTEFRSFLAKGVKTSSNL
jgi:hypothetical protein